MDCTRCCIVSCRAMTTMSAAESVVNDSRVMVSQWVVSYLDTQSSRQTSTICWVDNNDVISRSTDSNSFASCRQSSRVRFVLQVLYTMISKGRVTQLTTSSDTKPLADIVIFCIILYRPMYMALHIGKFCPAAAWEPHCCIILLSYFAIPVFAHEFMACSLLSGNWVKPFCSVQLSRIGRHDQAFRCDLDLAFH